MSITVEPVQLLGRRRPDGTPFVDLAPGDYCRRRVPSDGDVVVWRWWVCCPDDGVMPLAGCHQAEMNEDGSVTAHSLVSPRGWRGFIRAGTWEAT